MTTSSPGFQRGTPAPTFQTMPEASEPPMWWPYCGWSPYENTLTGLPRAAQTLLKFTPAAITRTITSKAPGSGTSISSSWKAVIGSPSRSGRITHAAIASGSSPGSTSSFATSVMSTATRVSSGLPRGHAGGAILNQARQHVSVCFPALRRGFHLPSCFGLPLVAGELGEAETGLLPELVQHPLPEGREASRSVAVAPLLEIEANQPSLDVTIERPQLGGPFELRGGRRQIAMLEAVLDQTTQRLVSEVSY